MDRLPRTCNWCAEPLVDESLACSVCERENYSIGVLFVHGIGVQERTQTLAEFGEPVLQWLDDRFAGLDQRWRYVLQADDHANECLNWRTELESWANAELCHADDNSFCGDRSVPLPNHLNQKQINKLADQLGTDILIGRSGLLDTVVTDSADPSAPAHSKFLLQSQRLDQALASEHWVIAESWWAESFNPPRFKNLASWGTRVIPWTMASHFGARVRQAMALSTAPDSAGVFARLFQKTSRLLRIVAAGVSFLLGMMISPILMLVFALLLFVSLIPISAVREVLQKLQMRLASTMGDSFVLLSHPVYAASIIGKVRRDVAWLAKRCDAVVVVAHSQGGAVAHLAAQHGINKKHKLLITFGSGLKKLELLNFILSTGRSFRRSAILNMLALPIFAFSAFWMIFFILRSMTPDHEVITTEMSGAIGVMLGYLVVSALVVYATSRDFIKGITPPALSAWIKKLKASPLRWIDQFATADPVSNGSLMNDEELGECSKEVCNLNSIIKDHTAYWQNRDQFISNLMSQLGDTNFRAANAMRSQKELTLPKLDLISARRCWRVGTLRYISSVGWLSLLVVVLQNNEQVGNFVGYVYDKLFTWMPFLHSEHAQEYAIAWPTVGFLCAVIIPYLIARNLWQRWNKSEMLTIVRGENAISGGHIFTMLALLFQLLGIFVIVLGMPDWIMFVIFMVVVVGATVSEPTLGEDKKRSTQDKPVKPDKEISEGEKILSALMSFSAMIAPPFALGIVFWLGFRWLWLKLLPDALLFGIVDPQNIPPPLIGVIAALVAVPLLWRRIFQTSSDQRNG